jgi:regulatory protein spx
LLERLIDANRVEDFLNTRSPVYKEMNLGARKLTKSQAIDLMLKEPNLIRRPLLLKGKKAVFGYKPEQYDELIRK